MPSIRLIGSGYDVKPLLHQIESNPDAWNRHRMRTDAYDGHGPHKSVSDIWVRYNAWSNFDGNIAKFNDVHESTWYPVIRQIPAAWSLCRKVVRRVGGGVLGGVLITKIPPGGQVAPHIDHGWHARHYEKFAIQVKGNDKQAFCFEDAELRPLPGDLYMFDNSRLHWVINESDDDRITLIICIRRSNEKPL